MRSGSRTLAICLTLITYFASSVPGLMIFVQRATCTHRVTASARLSAAGRAESSMTSHTSSAQRAKQQGGDGHAEQGGGACLQRLLFLLRLLV